MSDFIKIPPVGGIFIIFTIRHSVASPKTLISITIISNTVMTRISDLRFRFCFNGKVTASVVSWSEFLATDTEVPGSIPGATRFSV
jgi:hypothetical protein